MLAYTGCNEARLRTSQAVRDGVRRRREMDQFPGCHACSRVGHVILPPRFRGNHLQPYAARESTYANLQARWSDNLLWGHPFQSTVHIQRAMYGLALRQMESRGFALTGTLPRPAIMQGVNAFHTSMCCGSCLDADAPACTSRKLVS